MSVRRSILSVAVTTVALAASAGPLEVGSVEWRRDFDAVLRESARTGKPVFAFFQEVPGCGGCKRFGSEVMSHPAIVQAIENEFIPVLIYNNRAGKDADLLQRFGEPPWNYQVIRFLDGTGGDLIPRKDRVWTLDALAFRMIEALEAAGRAVPEYLVVVAFENDEARMATVAFAQSCFWSGEARLGRIHGVISTEAGWLEGREVTLVRYRTDAISLETLMQEAIDASSADKVFLSRGDELQSAGRMEGVAVGRLDRTYRRAPDSDQKRQIRGTAFEQMSLSPMQRTKVNSFAGVDLQKALAWLTPKQRREFDRLAAPR